jgi:polysaccharide export outer membrane protein
MKSNQLIILCATLVFLSSVLGCGGNAVQYPSQKPTPAYNPVMSEYHLQPGDNLDIKFFYNPELNENVTIRPDGRISLQLIDEVKAAGLTPAQLDDILTQQYGGQLKSPIIAVIVKSFEGQRIYVGGEVNAPQVLIVVGTINALQAIFNAGGFTPDAQLSSTVIISRGPDNRPVARIVDMGRAIRGELTDKEYQLHPYDMVYVPKTTIARADQFLTHLYSFIPPNIGLGFTYELHAVDAD